jgi:sugar phosphate isomerase/epimerase
MRFAFALSAQPTEFAAVGQGELPAMLRVIREVGYDGVELAVRDPDAFAEGELEAWTREAGLPVCAIGTGQAFLADGLSLAAPDESARGAARARLRRHIALAGRLGARVIVGLLRGRTGGDPGARARLVDSLRDAAGAAASAGVWIAVEPINRYETDWFPTVESVALLAHEVGAPNVGVLADTFHMNIEEAEPLASLRAFAPFLAHVHAADSNRLAPGWGHLDFGAILGILNDESYAGWVSAEVLPWPDVPEAARQAISELRRASSRGPARSRTEGEGGT